MRRIKCFFAMLFFITTITFPSYAEEGTVEWNGKTTLKNGIDYTISKSISIKSDFTLPPKSSLTITDNGKLTISEPVDAVIRGSLTIEIGGVLAHKYGTITAKKDSSVIIRGEYLQYVDTTLKIQTENFVIHDSGGYTGSSVLQIFTASKVVNKGMMTFTKSSDITVSGSVENEQGAELKMQGAFALTKSGNLINKGYISIGKNGSLRNSGKFINEREGDFSDDERYTETKSGYFIDYRYASKNEEMTVSILENEPNVKLYGIDVSQWQGDIDWKKVAASGDVDFAIIRAGRGKTNSSPIAIDTKFKKNIKEATENGIDVGVYFYSYAKSLSSARAEAEFLVKTIAPYKVTYPIVLDIEDDSQLSISRKNMTSMVEVFFEVLTENGYYPMLYSYKSWLEDNLDMKRLEQYAVWVAHVNVNETTYKGDYYIWQYSWKGSINGIKGDVDLNISYRDFPAILEKYNLNKLYEFK